MIYCVWYPSGGFGSYLSAVLDRYGKNFVKPDNKHIILSADGNSHLNTKIVPIYRNSLSSYEFEFDHSKGNYSVLIDNGINDEGTEFLNVFPNSQIIKVCYNDQSWPVVAHTMIVKAQKKTLESELSVDQSHWSSHEDWTVREKYFLFLTEHYLRSRWNSDQRFSSLDVNQVWNYHDLVEFFESIGIAVDSFEHDHLQWQQANQKYFEPVHLANTIIEHVKQKQNIDLSHINDIWCQAVINYFVYVEFGIVVPANTYANWFNTTEQLWIMIDELSNSAA